MEIENYSGEGPYLKIGEKEYLDCCSGTFNLALGYSAKPVILALKQQLDRCAHLSSEHTKDMSESIFQQLIPHLPEHINRFWFRDITGSTANECAIRIAQKSTQKTEVVSLFLSHHGQSLITTNLSGNSFRRASFSPVGHQLKVPAPDCNNCFYNQKPTSCNTLCATRIEDFLEFASTGQVAAVIVEPIMGNGGNIVPPKEFYKKLREICDRNNVLIIADEVQTGFGRTGSFFATNGYAKDLKPDIITFAKGAGGIGIPVAGVLMRKELDILESWEHSFTSGANPLALVALSETIKYIDDEKLLSNVNRLSPILKEKLKNIEVSCSAVSNVRGEGLMLSFDLPSSEDVKNFITIAKSNGLITRPSRYGFGKAVKVRPPLIINEVHILEIESKMLKTLGELYEVENYEVS